MALICNICEQRAKYRLTLDCGRFENKLFYCEKHKPLEVTVGEMDENQSDENKKNIIEEKFVFCEQSEVKNE